MRGCQLHANIDVSRADEFDSVLSGAGFAPNVIKLWFRQQCYERPHHLAIRYNAKRSFTRVCHDQLLDTFETGFDGCFVGSRKRIIFLAAANQKHRRDYQDLKHVPTPLNRKESAKRSPRFERFANLKVSVAETTSGRHRRYSNP